MSLFATCTIFVLSVVVVFVSQNNHVVGAQVSMSVDHDMSKPTFGLQGRSSSSLSYDDKNGLSLHGTIADLLGPPIKIANGFNNIVQGGNMAGIGNSLRSGGALLGIDAKLLEAAGGAKLAKGGLLLNGAAAKSNAVGNVAGPTGEKISNIIEFPVKVVAVKDLAAGKALNGLGQVKQAQAQAVDTKGQTLISQGTALKSKGMNQVVQGAQEGVQNIGNMVQKTSENIATAYKFLPLIVDLQTTNPPVQQQQQQLQLESKPHQLSMAIGGGGGQQQQQQQQPSGGSLFGGLSSLLMPGLGSHDPLGLSALTSTTGQGSPMNNRHQFGSLFGANGPNPSYAAVLNASSPLTSLLLNPMASPFLFPNPLVQALNGLQPIGTEASAATTTTGGGGGGLLNALNGRPAHFEHSLFPGVKVSETTSSQLPQLGHKFANAKQQHQNVQQQQIQAPLQQQQQHQVHQIEKVDARST